MSEPTVETKGGTRREFMVGAGVVAGGATLLGLNRAAEAQAPQSPPPAQGPGGGKGSPNRASAPARRHLDDLGPLAELGGTWVGHGFNMISLPDFQDGNIFRVKVNATDENLQFTQIGGAVPNRGSFTPDQSAGQKDISIFGVSYLQRVSDARTNSALHIEPGVWLHVPLSTIPNLPATVVRQGSIPHGTSILAQGLATPRFNGPPQFQVADSTPSDANGLITSSVYLQPFQMPPDFPPSAKLEYLKNPNLALKDAIDGQTIIHTQVLDISTVIDPTKSQGGGVLNIPFLDSNAKVVQFSATFWIETVQRSDMSTFMQLQYTQTIILNFFNINWPHISVATLTKQ